MTKPSWRHILLKGARTFPEVPWRSPHRWRTRPITFVILNFGLVLFGVGDGFILSADLGSSPWALFHQGVQRQFGISYGMASALTSVCILLLWIPLKEKPGLGTICNAFVIGFSTQATMHVVGQPTSMTTRLGLLAAGLAVVGLGIALYITTNLGPGPRDGLMTAIHDRTGIRVSRVRLSIELLAMGCGWLMGGTIGLGTIAFAAFIGRSMALWLGVLARLTHTP
jgi:uncharacterized membrane protein YczE